MMHPSEPLKIAYAIASRGRPSALIGVIASAWRLQSGANLLAFTVAVDDDDEKTLEALDLMKRDGEFPVQAVPAPRAPYMAAAQNRAVAAAGDADLVCLISDRTFQITPGHDVGIVDAAMRFPHRVLWYSSPNDPDTTTPIIPHTVLDALDWKPLPEIYVYWFSDTHLMEVDRMCFGGPSLRIKPMVAGARGRTTRGREFRWWTELYIALRPRRLAEAKRLNAALGLEWKDPPPEMLEDFAIRDRHLLEHAADFEARFGDRAEPGPEYREAKAKAEKLMEEMANEQQ